MSASNPTSPAETLMVDGQKETINTIDAGSHEMIHESFHLGIEEIGMENLYIPTSLHLFSLLFSIFFLLFFLPPKHLPCIIMLTL
jgi:hypothetical protein